MKKLIVLAFLFSISTPLLATDGIKFFEGTLQEAQALAAKEHKIIFMDAYTAWCGPCKRMAKNVFTQKIVGDFYNKYFINMKVDMEKGEGPKIATKYRVSSYPTFLFINEKGEIVHLAKGGRPAESFIAIGKAALNKDDKSAQYAAMYELGERKPSFLMAYALALQKSAKPSLKIANEYLRTQSDLTTDQNIDFIFDYAIEADSKIFNYLVLHKNKVIAKKSKEAYEAKVLAACDATINKAVKYKVEALLKEAQKQMKAANPKFAKEYAALANVNYNKGLKNEKATLKAIEKYLKKFAKNNAEPWHDQAGYLLKNNPDKTLLQKAEMWVKKAIAIDNKEEYIQTHSIILKKLGRAAEATQLLKNTEDLKNKLNH